jgi:hypothetical protein
MAYKSVKPYPQPSSNDKDSPLSNANHNRGFDPSKSSERARMSDKMNSDAGQYKGSPGEGYAGQAGSALNSDSKKYRK